MNTLPGFLSHALFPDPGSVSQTVHGSTWSQGQTDGHLSVLARSPWFCALVENALPDLSVDSASGELCWQDSPLAAPPGLDRCLAAALHAVCRTAAAQATASRNGFAAATAATSLGRLKTPSSASWLQPPPLSPPPRLLLTALRKSLLTRLLPNLLACKAPLIMAATTAVTTAISAAGAAASGATVPSTAAPRGGSAGGGGGGATALFANAHPAAAVLCRTAVELAVTVAMDEGAVAAGDGGDMPSQPEAQTANAAAVLMRDGDESEADGGAYGDLGGGSAGLLEHLVASCCRALELPGQMGEEACAGGGGDDGGGGLSLGRAAAVYTLTGVCVAMAGNLSPACAGEVRQVRHPGGGGIHANGCGGGVLRPMLELLCGSKAQRMGVALRQHLHALLIPSLMRACAVQMPPEDYAAAATQCLTAVRGGDLTEPRGCLAPAAAAAPPNLAMTPAIRAAVTTLAALEARHVTAAVRHSPDLVSWLLSTLLPPALLAPGDRPTRARALHLLRTLTGAGVVPVAAVGAGGGGCGGGGPAAVGSWGVDEWSALADLLHVLEERMFHLVQPVWSCFMPMLMTRAAPLEVAQPAAAVTEGAGNGVNEGGRTTVVSAPPGVGTGRSLEGSWSTATWLAVPIFKACQHVNVSVRRLGLYSVLHHALQPCPSGLARPAGWWAHLLTASSPQAGPLEDLERSSLLLPLPLPLPPALWLLEQLLLVLECDKISWEHMPGCNSIQRHMSAVLQLRKTLTAVLACTLRHQMAVAAHAGATTPAVAANTTAVAGTFSAAAVVQFCLRFALQSTQRATAAAFVLTALQGALAELSDGGGRGISATVAGDGGGGGGGEGADLATVTAELDRITGAAGLLRGVFLPLLTRQALQHPRDLQIQIRTAVLHLVPFLVHPASVSVADALELLSSSAAPPTASGVASAAAAATAGCPASSTVALATNLWIPRFQIWLNAVLDERAGSASTSSALGMWLTAQLLRGRLSTQSCGGEAPTAAVAPLPSPQRQLSYLEALAAAAPWLTPGLQHQVFERTLSAVATFNQLPAPGGDEARCIGAEKGSCNGGRADGEASGAQEVDSLALLMLLTALHRAYTADAASPLASPPPAALCGLMLAAAPRLLSEFWRRNVKSRTWDERTAYGIIQLADVLGGGSDGRVYGGREYGAALLASCIDWPAKLLRNHYGVVGIRNGGGASGATGDDDDGSIGDCSIGTMALDQQLIMLAAGCVASRTVRTATAAAAATNAAVGTSAIAAATTAVVALVSTICDLEPSPELSPKFVAVAAAGAAVGGYNRAGGGGSSARLELLPLFMELRWRLVSEVLASRATAVGISGPLRRALCERALEDLDCAPDRALPYILDTLLAAAPYDAVLHAVHAAVTATDGSSSTDRDQAKSVVSEPEAATAAPGAAESCSGINPNPVQAAAAAAAAAAATAAEAAAAEAAAAEAAAAGTSGGLRARDSGDYVLEDLQLLQRIQSAVVSAVRGARRVAPALAVRAPQLACNPALLLAGCAADRVMAGPAAATTTAAVAAEASDPGRRQPQRQSRMPEGKERAWLAAASKLAAATSATVVPQLLQYGGSRVALATAAHICRAVLEPHLELRMALLLPLVHLLVFSSWTDRVDAKGLLSRKFEPHQALPARAAVCAWLERLTGQRHKPFLESLMCALLRVACGCRRGMLPPGLVAVTTGPAAAVAAGTGSAGGGKVKGDGLPGSGSRHTSGDAVMGETEPQGPRRRRGGGGGSTAVTPPETPLPQALHLQQDPCLGAATLAQDYAFLLGREASQSSTLNAMKVALWQTICLLARRLEPPAAGGAVRAVWQCLEYPNHQSNLRPLMQQALLALLDRWPGGAERLLLPALRRYDTASYQVCVSLVIIGSLLLLRQATARPQEGPLAQPLLEALMPWALHHRHAVRVPVQTVLHIVLDQQHSLAASQLQQPQSPPPSLSKGDGTKGSALAAAAKTNTSQPDSSPPQPLSPPEPAPLQQPLQLPLGPWEGIREFLDSNPEQAALCSRQALVDFGRFDLEFECSLQGLFGIREDVLMAAATAGEALEVDPGYPSAWAIHTRDRLPIDVLRALPAVVRSLGANRRRGVTTATASEPANGIAADANDTEDENEGDVEDGDGEEGAPEPEDGGEDGEYGGAGALPHRSPSGTTVTAVAAAAVTAAHTYQLRPQLLEDPRGNVLGGGFGNGGYGGSGAACTAVAAAAERLDALAAAAAQASRPTGIIVVASLLENVPNMAGLCRTCESLGCEALVLPSRAVISSEAFKRQAVTSERWLPLHEVGPLDLATYLVEMRGRGYRLVGVEQAASSVPLQAFTFPAHCVLLLGNEQSGVPQQLITVLDACVEIPMVGVTRSLNAHVSGAMAVWQYVQQQQQQQQRQQQQKQQL